MTTQDLALPRRRGGPPTERDRPSFSARIVTLMAIALPPLALLSVTGVLWGVAVGPVDLAAFAVMYVACGLGVTVGFHRLFSHRAFKTTPAMRALWAVLGSMAMQGPVTQWVTDHRRHHAMSDKAGDPHSPHVGRRHGWWGVLVGLFHAHMGWLLTTKGLVRAERYARDLYEDRLVRTVDRLYMLWVALTFGIPFLIGYLAGGLDVAAGVQTLVWAGALRVFLFDHITWSVNSICHMYGRRPFATDDESRNFWPLALPTFGEAWHNNHHAFPGSAVHGLGRRQPDVSWWVIRGMARLGLAWDLKVPSAGRQAARRAHESA